MKFILSSLFVFSSYSLFAQVPLNSVVESFTNTQCSACASRNPGFHSNVVAHPSITLLTINPSLPYPGCILSIQNKTDNDDRTKVYSIFGGTPRIVVNGNVVPSGTSYSAASVLSPYVGLMSPVSIRIEQTNFGKDSIKAKVIIKKHVTTPANARLFLGLVEDTVFVDGGNGETKHFNVLRKSLSGSVPQALSLGFPVGDSVSIEMTGVAAAFWDMNRMFAMAILHEETTNKVLQTAKSTPFKPTLISARAKNLNVSIYPNPVHDFIVIAVEKNQQSTYKLYDMQGKIVAQSTFLTTIKIPINHLINGNYMLEVSTESEEIAYKKVIVQH